MILTPIEIRQKTFSKKFRGYDTDEVDTYLHSISMIWENLSSEINSLKDEISNHTSEIQRLRKLESSLMKTIQNSEDTASNIVTNAEKQAKTIIQKAQVEAEKILFKGSKELLHIEKKLKDAREDNKKFTDNLLKIANKIIDHYKN